MTNEEIMQKFIYLPSDMEITKNQIFEAMDAARQDERDRMPFKNIERILKKFERLKINDKMGWTGEWRMSVKDILDVIIDLQNSN